MAIELLLIITFLLASGFFSGIEIAFISANRLRIELENKKGSRRGRILSSFIEKPSEFLGTTLVGNNIVLVILGILSENFIRSHTAFPVWFAGEFSLMLSITIVTTLILLIFGEFLPKVSFQINATGILFLFTYPLALAKWLLTPIVWIMVSSSYALLNIFFKIKPELDQQVFTKLDLEHFIKNIQTDEEDLDKTMFHNALYINNVKIKDCMIPRSEIEAIDISSSIDELKQKFIETRISRILVYEGDIDEIKGYVHHQNLLDNPKSINEIRWDIPMVHEFMPAKEVMNRLIKQSNNIAWVIDERGGTAGVVTLEDILEEIFGEITDEHDTENLHQKLSDGEYLFSGRLEIDFINEEYHLHLPESDEYHTLSGFIISHLETIPEQGQQVILDGYEFILKKVSDTKIDEVHVRYIYPADEE
ncbi:MAG: HlyC/CorC family transporter [Aureispira sp.]|nr:HlyC/CorC family transporter [Aureispira sp.]